jgi:hypothetical protein
LVNSFAPSMSLQAHVRIEARGVERLDRRGGLVVVDGVAHLHRQVGEDGARLGSLHAFDLDVAHDERLHRGGGQRDGERHREDEAEAAEQGTGQKR